MQVPPRGAKRVSSDGVTIEEYRPVDQWRSMKTVAEVYTNFTDKSEPTLSQGSAVVAEEAGTDGTTNVRDRSIDQKIMKTTNMQMPMDFLEIPEPTRLGTLKLKVDNSVIRRKFNRREPG